MDINSLLSPTSTGPATTPRSTSLGPGTPSSSVGASAGAGASAQSPLKYIQRTHSGPSPATGASRAAAAGSPLTREILPPSGIPAHIRSPSQRPLNSSPLISPVPTGMSQPPMPRTSSTHSMDTLADLASMQNHQPPRSTPPTGNSGSSDSQRPSIPQQRPSFDIAMVETPKQLLRGDFTGTSLPLDRQQRLAELVGVIQETPSAYETHIEIIKLLHQGFVNHIYPSSSPNARNNPNTYDLLPELRQARENAVKLFAVGEEQWLDWLQDESILAQSAEERVAVIELCRRAVEEEYGSARLWNIYGDWVLHCYTWAHEPATSPVAEEEKMVGRELFRSSDVLSTWEDAVRQTRHDMAMSHIVWDNYLKTSFPDYEEKVPEEKSARILDLFQSRLVVPHARWESSFQAFSSFVSANCPSHEYEQIMARTLENAAAAKAIYQIRETYENALAQAADAGDKYAEYQCFTEYIAWEKSEEERLAKMSKKQKKREPIQDPAASARMINALYQRAELRLPTVLSIWEEHASYLAERRERGDRAVLELLLRATKHCPWSGSLWKRLLLASEIADLPFAETEAIQQNATKSGMIDAAGIEEVLKVHDAWCGYLLRRTRRPDATEEDADVAEMGIRTSIEAVQSLASKLDGETNVDASFRLQRKYIEYLKGQGRFDNARKEFEDAAPVYGKFYRFWLRFYEFEMQASLHISSLQQDSRDGVTLHSSAPFAVGILKKGLDNPKLDYPEYLMEALVNHCEDYEDAEELQSALLLVDRVQKRLADRRQREAEVAAEQAAAVPAKVIADQRTEEVASGLHIGKRKREDAMNEDETNKRVRNEDDPTESVEEPVHEQLKRDREHAIVLVQNVSPTTTETRVRQYFSNCGHVISLKAVADEEHSYIVEFKEADEAQYALSRNEQNLDGAIISVSLNTGNTLYVTNYPSAFAEADIEELFRPYADTLTIRFPSLQANKRRRFCYVELKTPSQARAALELDGHKIGDLALTVKISNPAVRKQRDTTAKSDGRTIFIGQLNFKAQQQDIRGFFAQYGEIERVRVPQDQDSTTRNKGIAFITFSERASAEAALHANGQLFQERRIKVSIARDKDARHESAHPRSVDGRSTSPASAAGSGNLNGAKISSPVPPSAEAIEDRRARTIFLTDVPDTVNEAQIRGVAAKHGNVRKVILKTQFAGAIVEFESSGDAGRAEIGLEGHEFASGSKKIRVVNEREMKQGVPEIKSDKLGGEKKVDRGGTAGAMMAPSSVRRPGAAGGFGGRKGGNLGRRTALGLGWSASPATTNHSAQSKDTLSMKNGKQDNAPTQDAGTGKRSNDDFRAMLNKT